MRPHKRRVHAVAAVWLSLAASLSLGAAPTGKFGGAIDIANRPLRTRSLERYGRLPLTVEMWVKLPSDKKERFHLLASNAPGAPAAHWEIYTTPLHGYLTARVAGVQPSRLETFVRITDDRWRHVAMFCDEKRLAVYVDGKLARQQAVSASNGKPAKAATEERELFLGMDRKQPGKRRPALVDELRISGVARRIESVPDKPLAADGHTLSLWRFDETSGNRYRDSSASANELAYSPEVSSAWTPRSAARPDAADWEKEDDDDWLDARFNQMEKGPFLGVSMSLPGTLGKDAGPFAGKGLAIRIGEEGEAAVLFNRGNVQLCGAWAGGFLHIPHRRFGLIQHPRHIGAVIFSTPNHPGGRRSAKYQGLYLHGRKTILHYTIGRTRVLETPWTHKARGLTAVTRTIEFTAGEPLDLHVLECRRAKQTRIAGIDVVTCPDKDNVVAVALQGDKSSARLEWNDGRIKLRIGERRLPLVAQLLIWRGSKQRLSEFAALVKSAPPPKTPNSFIHGGRPRWTKPITTVGRLGKPPAGKPFAVDTLTLPYDNPYRSIFYVTGVGFLPDGRAAISTIYGDVWLVGGIDGTLNKLTWKRFAAGMYQPLGLAVKEGIIYVLERGQITRLHDLNGDDEADFYQSFYHGWETPGSGHAYDTALKLAPDGSFYFFKGQTSQKCRESGCLLKVAADGSGHEIFATGFRHPIGLGAGPDGTITGGDQQGNWMPATRIDQYRRGGFYGDMRTHHRPKPPRTYDKPICWLPRYVDNSAGGQVWIPKGQWGPLAGKPLHFSWGRCRLFCLLQETVDGQRQGGVVRLPCQEFLSGPITGAFRQGHLYVAGLHGWQTAGEKDGCLQRVRHTGGKTYLPIGLHARKDGLLLRFSEPIDEPSATDVSNYTIEQWNYRYSADYGSDHWSVSNPNRMGHDRVPIAAATLTDDRRGVLLRIPGIQPVMQMKVSYRLKAADGTPMEDVVHHTIHKLAR